jgi:hypothetical protein
MSGGAGFAGNAGRIYGLVLLLLAMLFFMVTFRGKVPHAIDKVFQAPVDEAVLEGKREDLRTLVGGAYLDPPDGIGFAQTPGYRRLVQMLIDHVRPGDIVENPPLFNRELAMRAPDMQRGEVVKLRGLVVDHWAEQLDPPVFEVDAMWHVVLADYDGTDGVIVDVVAQPPALIAQRTPVEIVAHFYRLVRYESKNDTVLQVPYLLAREVRLVPEEPRSVFGSLDPATAILVVALGAMIAFGVIRVVSSRARRPTVQWRAPHLHSKTSQPSSEGQH